MKTKLLLSIFLLNVSYILIAQIIHVPGDHPTIQDGINAANNGDTVLVADNTYFENINFNGKAITLASNFILDEDTTHINNTIIDGSQPSDPDSASVVYFISGENTNSILQGFTITGGKGTFMSTNRRGGGGILCYYSGAQILNNNIERDSIFNEDDGVKILGGGLYYFADNEWNDTLVIKNNKFRWNYLKNIATERSAFGSALALSCRAIIVGNEITHNEAESNKTRASVYCISPPAQAYIEIADNTISYNNSIGTGSNSRVYGSGIYINRYYGYIKNNRIEYNQATNGEICHGPLLIYYTDSTFVIENNIISCNEYTNSTVCWGGGLSLRLGTAKIVNNLIFNNKAVNGGGISIYDTLANRTQIINNTIVQNLADFGGGILSFYDSPIVLNSIIYSNSAFTGPQIHEEEGYAIVNYSNIEGGWTGTGNIDSIPQFVDPENGDFHIEESSPCAGAGIDSLEVNGVFYSCPSFDFENEPRPMPFTYPPDMGADEVDESTEIPKIIFSNSKIQISNYPNPFTNNTMIEFNTLETGFVQLSVVDFIGREVQLLVSERITAGTHQIDWNMEGLEAGIYFGILKTNSEYSERSMKMIKLD